MFFIIGVSDKRKDIEFAQSPSSAGPVGTMGDTVSL